MGFMGYARGLLYNIPEIVETGGANNISQGLYEPKILTRKRGETFEMFEVEMYNLSRG